MLTTFNRALRRQRRRLVVLGAVLALAGAVTAAHGLAGGEHMGDTVAMCLAVAETVVFAAGAALALAKPGQRPAWRIPILVAAPPGPAAGPARLRCRAGPPLLQVFRL